MRLLDLFCGAGGAARGYQQAGFYVIGVDVANQPRFAGDGFLRMGWSHALDLLNLETFDAIHASPPCQEYSMAQRIKKREHPDLVAAVRERLDKIGKPYVIENVPGAPLINPVLLDGTMFDGLRTKRPRLFEANWPLSAPFLRQPPPPQVKMGRVPKEHEWIQVVGNFSDVKTAREAMGIDWMTRDELREAIPPAYTEFIGKQLIERLEAAA